MRVAAPSMLLTGWLLLGFAAVANADSWIGEIQANPARYWNTTVTVTGHVLAAGANPAGTNRGSYTITDDSSATPLLVLSTDLPPVGRTFAVTGRIVRDSQREDVPILNEIGRAEPGMSKTLERILMVAAALLLVLLVALVSMLLKPSERRAAVRTVGPASGPTLTPPPASFDRTRRVAADEPKSSEKTRLYVHLGMELVVERGPDRDRVFPLHQHVTTIGRSGARQNEIELTDDTVSKEQASIHYDPASKTLTIINESSTNPTVIDDVAVEGEGPLEPDAKIVMGGTTLRLRSS